MSTRPVSSSSVSHAAKLESLSRKASLTTVATSVFGAMMILAGKSSRRPKSSSVIAFFLAATAVNISMIYARSSFKGHATHKSH